MRSGKSLLGLAVLVVAMMHGLTLNAAQCSAKSGQSRVALLELYTSEGCSSCPPADKWLSSLASKGVGAKQLLPLSLHVDYWNYIGWRDPYSSSEYTQRQRGIAQRNRLRSIYTPQLVFNGRDYRGWRRQNIELLLNEVNAWPAAANLTLNWQANTDNRVAVTVSAELVDKIGTDSVLFMVLYENDLVSNVNAGENDGRSLHHDYVVREMLAIPFLDVKQFSKQVNFEIKPGWNRNNLGVAAFVQKRGNGEVLQALSSPLKCQS